MTRLQCGVTNCASNADNCCCRPNINVGVAEAKESNETCCSSFMTKSEGATNSCRHDTPNTSLDICCDACNCTHNEDRKCAADSIDVGCCCNKPDSSDGTKCATFESR